jgi:uncharacterized protein (TIGR02453 family)
MIPFLKKLAKNNNKAWFDANRPSYVEAKTTFENFVASLISAYGKHDPSIAHLTAKECMFRINRDVRFSKDKSPYKTNLGASISSGGKKSPFAGYYVHIEPGASLAGGGMWMPMPEQLAKVRQEIDYNFDEFLSLIKSPALRSNTNNYIRGMMFRCPASLKVMTQRTLRPNTSS